ncbi:hypothetical protein KBD61_00155 [Patescibacteria group bacterium]|nr:hypothetical protein [Patescibacteria group bacterium]MBP9709422.1 hypothetical protein [Patescibacteria group bacterium]
MSSLPPDLQGILDDLYKEDPSLRSQEADLIPLLQKLITSRPEATFNARARSRLKQELLQVQTQSYPRASFFSSFFSSMPSLSSLKPWAAPVGALALVLVAVMASTWRSAPQVAVSPLIASNITTVSPRAFGNLGAAAVQTGRGAEGVSASAVAQNPVGGSAKLMAQDMMIARPFPEVRYRYVYDGDLPAWEPQLNVYKRVKGASQLSALIQPLADTTRGLIDLASLQKLQLQTFTAVQDEPYGYAVTVDLSEGMVNLNQNYQQWPHPEALCRDEACYQQLRLNPGDVPSDEEALRIVAEFLQARGIVTTGYGTPRVINEWRTQYEAATDKSTVYVPDVVTVTYPVLVDGKAAYEQGGTAFGLMVNVSSRSRKVDSVWNLTTNTYEQSAYAAETNVSRIREVVEKGGVYGYVPAQVEKTVDITLNAPELVLHHLWLPSEPGKPMTELLVPALRFTVKDKPADGYMQDTILVPLIKDVLDQQNNPPIHLMVK